MEKIQRQAMSKTGFTRVIYKMRMKMLILFTAKLTGGEESF